jgi:hypothetical protein
MPAAETAAIQSITDGGYFLVISDAPPAAPKRILVNEVAAAVSLAATAIQPADLGTAASYDASDFASSAEIGDIAAALEAILGGGD